jgi:hypothetical protein
MLSINEKKMSRKKIYLRKSIVMKEEDQQGEIPAKRKKIFTNEKQLPKADDAKKECKFDDFVKNPSAALRFTFVVAAYLQVRLPPQFLCALHLELFTKPSFCDFL